MDKSGTLELTELRRGFLAAGIDVVDWVEQFGSLDADGDQVCMLNEWRACVEWELPGVDRRSCMYIFHGGTN